MTISTAFTFFGGIGLFLLGMRLMTDGLKVAAGETLRAILAAATKSRLRGLASGVLITAMVQSSSAVIFATVGFVNAGLLSLYQAIGIIYGANLGTTLTSWIVAILGFNVNLQAMAMPAIGIGMGLWLAFGSRRYGALGQALVGFGIFFLGIDILKDTFADMGDNTDLGSWADQGVPGLLLFVLIGIMLTLLMQSSSAALAVTLTAAAGGLIPLSAAAAMVIGANVGTSSTAAFAAVGATAPAKRAASAHVIFNVITGLSAFLLLPFMLWVVALLANALDFTEQVATSLAVFHTLANIIGLLIIWPLTGLLVKWLEARFHSIEEDESRPKYLDRNVQATPTLAMDALILELTRMSETARDLGREAISAEHGNLQRLAAGHHALATLNLAVADFAGGISREAGDATLLGPLSDALRVAQYLENLAEKSVGVARLKDQAELGVLTLAEPRDQLRAHAVEILTQSGNIRSTDSDGESADTWNLEKLSKKRQGFETDYQSYKNLLLRSGTAGEITPRRMTTALEQMSALHTLVDQATKAAKYLNHLRLYRTQTDRNIVDSGPVSGTGSGTGSGKEEDKAI